MYEKYLGGVMPFRKYRCQNCDEEFKELVRDEEEVTCINCGSPELETLPPSISLQFKGSGFYRTDYGEEE